MRDTRLSWRLLPQPFERLLDARLAGARAAVQKNPPTHTRRLRRDRHELRAEATADAAAAACARGAYAEAPSPGSLLRQKHSSVYGSSVRSSFRHNEALTVPPLST